MLNKLYLKLRLVAYTRGIARGRLGSDRAAWTLLIWSKNSYDLDLNRILGFDRRQEQSRPIYVRFYGFRL